MEEVNCTFSLYERYDLVKYDKKELWLIKGIGHADGYEHDSTVYFNKIFKFIDSNIINDKN
ncbi:hypothetical protein [Clostridioides sp. ES-S-0108-01]|uniref:hypothetical protein n=1 Tax=Clostridioides sp. ES-S-0108-01 TaxID=2770773 RepID=UPI001D0C2BA5